MPHHDNNSKPQEDWKERFGEELHTFISPANCLCCQKMGNGCSMAYLNSAIILHFIESLLSAERKKIAGIVDDVGETYLDEQHNSVYEKSPGRMKRDIIAALTAESGGKMKI